MKVDWDELAKKHGFDNIRDLIIDLYYRQSKSIQDLHSLLGVSRGSLYSCLNQLNLPSKGRALARYVAGPPCPKCGATKARIIYSKGFSFGHRRIKVCKECGNKFVTIERVKE